MKEIRVTCRAADILPIDSLIEFQGNLKSISKDNLDKLKRSILRHGFTAPFFIWHGVDYHILDGHQRLKALCSLREEGYDMPLLPVVYIEADNEAEAKEKLLYITSQYGEFSTKGFFEFSEGIDLDLSEINLVSGKIDLTFDDQYDFTDFEKDMDGMDGLEDATISITVPTKYKDQIEEYLSNGYSKTAPGLGKGVMKLCGLL
jgi:hypothetical protein